MVSLGVSKSYERKNPENKREKVHKFVMEHRALSGFTVLGILGLIFFKIIPLSYFSFLPKGFGKFTVMVIIANLIAFLPSRWLYKSIREFPVDWIIEIYINADNQKILKAHTFYEGRFTEEYDIVEGKPLKQQSHNGKTVYIVNEVDKEEKEVVATELGEYDDIDFINAVDKIEANRLRNRRLALAGRKALSKLQTLADTVTERHFNRNKKEEIERTSYRPEIIMEEIKKEIPELVEEGEEEKDTVKPIEEVLDEIDSPQDEYDASLEFKKGGE